MTNVFRQRLLDESYNRPYSRLRFPVDSIRFGNEKVEWDDADRNRTDLDMECNLDGSRTVTKWSCNFRLQNGTHNGRFEAVGNHIEKLIMSCCAERKLEKTFFVFALNMQGRRANQRTAPNITATSKATEGVTFPTMVAFEINQQDLEISFGEFGTRAKGGYKHIMPAAIPIINVAMLSHHRTFKKDEAEKEGRVFVNDEEYHEMFDLRVFKQMLSLFNRYEPNREASGQRRKRAALEEEPENVATSEPVAKKSKEE